MSEKNNNQYGAFGGPTMSTSSYYLYPLKNCEKIIDFNSDEAEKGKPAIVQFGDNANQIAVARTLMGFIYMHLTDALGPLPYTEAFQAGEENFTPVFDSQETIYAKLDADLREAYNQFNESGSLSTCLLYTSLHCLYCIYWHVFTTKDVFAVGERIGVCFLLADCPKDVLHVVHDVRRSHISGGNMPPVR